MSDLRKLAEAATPGPWRHSSYGIMGFEEAVVSWRYAWEDSEERNRPYIVAADPPTILALLDERDSLATQLEQMRRDLEDLRARGVVPDADCTCGSGGHPRPCAKHPHRMEMHAREIDAENALEQMRRERDEARATNARLHRRAQGVDARKPDDEETIRRLRAEVAATAKHAGHVAGHVYRLQMATNFAQHATSMAVRERDEARAHAEERTAKVRDLARCAAASEARARAYAAKLARIREVAECDYHDTPRTVLRIIDEKEGGQ